MRLAEPPPSVVRFLQCERVALVGASGDPEHFSRAVLQAWTSAGYQMVPVHPTRASIGGLPAFQRVSDIKPSVDGVIVMTPADVANSVVEDAIEAGVGRIWLHRGAGPGAASAEAIATARAAAVDLVEGECPLMFLPHTGWVHRVHRFFRHGSARRSAGAAEALR